MFSSEKYSAALLPQWQNFSHLRNSLLFCNSATLVAEFFSSEKLSAILLFCSHTVARFFNQSASAIMVKLRHQSYYDYLFGLGGGGGGTELSSGLLESSLCLLPDVLLAGR